MAFEQLPDGRCRCTYTPSKPGQYILEITSGGKHVCGTPYPVNVPPAAAARDSTCALEGAAVALCAGSSAAVDIAASSARADAANTAVSTPNAAALASATAAAEYQHSAHATAAVVAPPVAAKTEPLDKSAYWERLAREAYAADGDSDGYSSGGDGEESPEDKFRKANPGVPVIDRLEDLWQLGAMRQAKKRGL